MLLALGSASSSMMLMPEVSSTAMGKFIVALQKNHNLIAKELGIPDETIKNLYASGHAMDAIVLVLEKMRDKGNMNALGGIFKDLGSDGQRLVTAMVTMSKNVDMLKDHLYESEEAFREATAVTNEYEMQQQSAIGIISFLIMSSPLLSNSSSYIITYRLRIVNNFYKKKSFVPFFL